MKSIGDLIKIERKEKGIKQVSLAKGICSTSYLSKIENNLIEGNEEIISLLINKVGLEIKRLSLEEEEEVLMELRDIYKKSLLERNEDYIISKLGEFEKQKIDFSNIESYYSYRLYIFRMKLITNKNVNILTNSFKHLLSYVNQLSNKQLFMYYQNVGLFYYLSNKPYLSISYFNEASKFIGDVFLEDWEIADFHNIQSAFYLNNNDNLISINHSYKALEYFKTHLVFDRMIENYMKLGIAYKNLLDYNKGEEFFLLSLDLADRFHIDMYKGAAYHNLGNLYCANNQVEQGLGYYLQSYEFKIKTNDLSGSLLTIFSLVKQYSKLKNKTEVLEWCNIGLKRNKMIKRNPLYSTYYYHFRIYQSLQKNFNEELTQLLMDAISYFEEIHDYRHIQKYSILLANKLVEHKKLKLATEYYRKSTEILYKQKSIELWEDL